MMNGYDFLFFSLLTTLVLGSYVYTFLSIRELKKFLSNHLVLTIKNAILEHCKEDDG